MDIKLEIKQETSYMDFCSENEREPLTKDPIKKVKSETVTSNSDCDTRTEIQEEDVDSKFCSQYEIFSEHNQMRCNETIKESEIKTEISIKEEQLWLETNSTEAPYINDDIKMGGDSRRKSTRQSWDEVQMQRAIAAVNSGEMGWLRASKQFSVPQATLRRRARNKNKMFNGVQKGLGRFQPTFNRELEHELVNHLKLLESCLFGMSVTDVRQLAFQIAEENGVDHRFNKEKKMAGWDWVSGFLKRNPGISLQKPEATSAARAAGFNKPVAQQFFSVYEEIIKKERISPCNIYNMDEFSLTTGQKTVKKQVGARTSSERGVHVTVVCCMSPSGFIPPMLIYPRKNWKNKLTDSAPIGTVGVAQETGWMTGDIFVQWLRHFCHFVKPSKENKVILLLDGHTSHKNVEALSYSKGNGIILLCLPAHRLQPLDVSFYGPLKTYYDQEVTRWRKCNPRKTISQYQICPLFAKAYGKAASIAIAESGFENSGLWPLNNHTFQAPCL